MKVAKYHEVVNMAITYAISLHFGGEHTPRSCLLITVARVLCKTNRSWDMNKELGGWEDGRWEVDLKSYTLMMMTAMNAVMKDWNHRKPRPFNSEALHRVSLSSSCSSVIGEDCRKLERQQQS